MSPSHSGSSSAASAAWSCTARTAISSRRSSRRGRTAAPTITAARSKTASASCARSRESIRQSCGADFVIGLKMPGDEGVAGGIDPDEAARITAALAQTGALDYFAYSQGNFTLSLENHAPDMHFRRGHFLDIHKKMRLAATGTPVMALGRIATPAEAEAAIADGAGDLVGMTRALIADADWPAKARDGRANDIRPSSFDNFAWGEIHVGRPLAEPHNPQLGQKGESGWRPGRAPQSAAASSLSARDRRGCRPRAIAARARPRRDAVRCLDASRRQAALGGRPSRQGRTSWRAGVDGAAGPSRRRRRPSSGTPRPPATFLREAGQRHRRDRLASAPAGQFFRRRRERARLDGAAGRRPHRWQRRCCSTWTTAPRPMRSPTRWRATIESLCCSRRAADRAQRQLLQHDRRPSPAV